ncbi:hypothetical protein HKCCE2091_12895 [Rhodobacterales bacterium HKCCE2091]|nr:hypothetical protein [Rhodobacterales bacterium HKCCE2091]
MRLTGHVVAQVRGNLGEAAKLTLLPYAGVMALAFWLGARSVGLMDAARTGAPPANGMFPTLPFLAFLLGAPVLLAWAAVGWHRYVLLEERGRGVVPAFDGSRVWGYIWRVLLIFLLIVIAVIVVALVIGIVAAALSGAGAMGEPGLVLLFGLGLNLAGSWMFVRFGLILPASAVGHPLRLGESWTATSEVSGEILVPIVAFLLVFGLIPQIIGLVIGGLAAALVSVAVGWLQMLANLALLTTLFGNRVEGRALN